MSGKCLAQESDVTSTALSSDLGSFSSSQHAESEQDLSASTHVSEREPSSHRHSEFRKKFMKILLSSALVIMKVASVIIFPLVLSDPDTDDTLDNETNEDKTE